MFKQPSLWVSLEWPTFGFNDTMDGGLKNGGAGTNLASEVGLIIS